MPETSPESSGPSDTESTPAKPQSLADAVCDRVANVKTGYASWYDRLPEELKGEFDEARKRFDHNTHQKAAYARALIQVAKERGIDIASENMVIRWLGQ